MRQSDKLCKLKYQLQRLQFERDEWSKELAHQQKVLEREKLDSLSSLKDSMERKEAEFRDQVLHIGMSIINVVTQISPIKHSSSCCFTNHYMIKSQ